MFGIGGPELAVILVLALVFVGPKKLPQVARTIGGAIRDLKRAANMAQSELRETVDELLREADLQDTFDELRRDIEMQPEERLKEIPAEREAKIMAPPEPPPKRVGVAARNRHPDAGFHVDNDDFDEAFDDSFDDDDLDDEGLGEAIRDAGAAHADPLAEPTPTAEPAPAAEVQLPPEPAPQRPGPVMEPVEGTVSWHPTADDSGEA